VRRFPFVRLGLLLAVGAVFVSLFQWYAAFGELLSDMEREVPTERPDLLDHFVTNFFLVGTVAGALFWAGAALILVGGVRDMLAAPRR
jgi:hypothetical protein